MKKENIKVETITLNELFTKYKRFIVPGYQRPYKWGKNQVERLLDDITKSFSDKPDDIILLGTIQLNEVYSTRGLKYFEIIDGHRRITTLWLLLEALHGKPTVEYKNNIQGYTSIQEAMRKDRAYTDNFDFISKYFMNNFKGNTESLLNFINNNICFIAITASECTSIEDILKTLKALKT